MRTVRLTRANGVNERIRGDAGAELALDDADAAFAVREQLAVYADDPGPPAQEIPVVKTDPGFEFPEHPRTVDVPDDFGQDPRYIGEDIARSREMKMPWTTHSKADWVAWAVYNGCEPAQANAMSKNALMSKYGERL